ncbi:TPA: type I toxin-antitoxin system Ibs family toxin [Escherichia coli]|nr:type I toxin-antitoxin system Ibs family toxin [Escherichia coli]EET1423451.1 type I toxin-antitoxin system Ibs family toxin [Escherichia coli]EEY7774777.1 type I toxin-antitoxin system Ibs family toxin [Escherichia coli]EFW5308291.1 type I toxin-antitoxin system Ibs family toxin [Escherichia coli]HCP1591573.1 type I toxin-antitoxin system Ibs family toxin [Escherichia coli]
MMKLLIIVVLLVISFPAN